jgi:hypothetical protein
MSTASTPLASAVLSCVPLFVYAARDATMRTLNALLALCLLASTGCADVQPAQPGDSGDPNQPGAGQTGDTPGTGGDDSPVPGPGGDPGQADEGGDGFETLCDEEVAQEDAVFGHALCLCGALEDVGQGLRTRSFSRTFGQDPGHGHVGINGQMDVIGYARVGGDLDVGGRVGGIGKITTEGDFQSGGELGGIGAYAVFGDARVNGNVGGLGYVKILGDLYTNGAVQTLGYVDYNTLGGSFSYDASYTPCGCSASEIIDVAAEVAAAGRRNDNGLLPNGGIGAREVVLREGDYYFQTADALIGAGRIDIEGRVRLFVDGDIDSLGHLELNLAQYAELELWVAGSVRTIGNIRFAREEDARARAFKLYVGGPDATVLQVGNARFFGAIYAPQADIGFVGNLQVFGAVVANNIRGAGNLDIFYDTDITVSDDCVDEHPDPADDPECKDDDQCADGSICDEVTHDCVDDPDESECEDDAGCVGRDICIEGECIVL